MSLRLCMYTGVAKSRNPQRPVQRGYRQVVQRGWGQGVAKASQIRLARTGSEDYTIEHMCRE